MINQKRVRRIKRAIYTFIILLLLLPLAALILMIVLLFRMNGELANMSQSMSGAASSVGISNTEQSSQGDGYVIPQNQSIGENGEVTASNADLDFIDDAPEDAMSEHDEQALPDASGSTAPEAGDLPPLTGTLVPNEYTPSTYTNLYFDTITSPVEQTSKTLYLSFDNTPNHYADDILSVLDKHSVKATFFVWGSGSDAFYKGLADSGHSIGIHSNSNTLTYDELYASKEAFFEDFSAIFDRIYQVTGERTRLYRLPGGSIHPGNANRQNLLDEIRQELDQRGFMQHDWNVSAEDAVLPSLSKNQVLNNLRASLYNGGDHIVVLLHDGSGEATVQALDEFITECLQDNYNFQALKYDTLPVSFLDSK